MNPPNLAITHSAFKAMVNEVLKYPDIETSWGLAGYVQGKRNVFITNIILPAPENIVRRAGTVVIGGEYQAEQLDWLARDQLKMKLKLKKDYPEFESRVPEYTYVFSGHSHHTLGLKSYSGVDNRSIRLAIVENGLDVAIGPLANIVRDNLTEYGGHFGDPVISLSHGVEMRFYYLSKEMVESGITYPVKVKARLMAEGKNKLPIPKLAWKYFNREFYMSELRQLQALEANVQVMHRDLPGFDHMVVQFLLTKPEWKSPLLINTDWNYPVKKPQFEVMIDGVKKEVPYYLGRKFTTRTRALWTEGTPLAASVRMMVEEGVL